MDNNDMHPVNFQTTGKLFMASLNKYRPNSNQ